jgi:uncharacterized lipoprotein YbaY
VGVIRGTLTYGEDHELTDDAHAVVALVEGVGGPMAGTIIATQDIEGPGAMPVAFELLYPLDATTAGTTYSLWAGIADGDLAWVTPVGVVVKAPWPVTEGVELPLEFRPDLLKAAVSGTITGIGLDSDTPAAYGTALVVRLDTGETVGFQVISPTGPTPLAFSVPYDPDAIEDDADYVVSGTVFDGADRWSTVTSVPVITKGNAKSGVVLTVTPVPEPPAPAPSPEASPAPAPVTDGVGGPGPLAILVILGLIAVGGAALAAYLRSRKTT